jgi:hypothetical protein
MTATLPSLQILFCARFQVTRRYRGHDRRGHVEDMIRALQKKLNLDWREPVSGEQKARRSTLAGPPRESGDCLGSSITSVGANRLEASAPASSNAQDLRRWLRS